MNEKVDEPEIDYRVRRGVISAYGRALKSSQVLWWTVCFFTLAAVVVLTWLLLTLPDSASLSIKIGLSITVLLVVVGFSVVWSLTNRNFIEPDLAFRKWLQQVCDGDLDARIELPMSHQHYKELNFHTRNLASSLMQLSTDMESVVEAQTRSLEQQKQVRDLLFHITADVARETERKEVLITVCRRLAKWRGRALIYGFLINDQIAECVYAASIDIDKSNHIVEIEPIAALDAEYLVDSISVSNDPSAAYPTEIRVPFDAGQRVVGMLLLKCDPLDPIRKEESERVLNTVSEQLSLFMTKQSAAEQAHGVRLLRERTALAAEIHDSLAQTLLASRYQVSLLRESMEDRQAKDWREDVKKLEVTIGDANQKVRELIHEYRTPIADQTSIDALQDSIDQFRNASGMDVFFQCDNRMIQFTPKEESVIKRIVGESLVNAQKYSNADVIRVYLHGDRNGIRTILVEDDGVGFNSLTPHNESKERNREQHFGISIMQERALSIGGVLNIESEPGEGTRMSLKLPPLLAA